MSALALTVMLVSMVAAFVFGWIVGSVFGLWGIPISLVGGLVIGITGGTIASSLDRRDY